MRCSMAESFRFLTAKGSIRRVRRFPHSKPSAAGAIMYPKFPRRPWMRRTSICGGVCYNPICVVPSVAIWHCACLPNPNTNEAAPTFERIAVVSKKMQSMFSGCLPLLGFLPSVMTRHAMIPHFGSRLRMELITGNEMIDKLPHPCLQRPNSKMVKRHKYHGRPWVPPHPHIPADLR